MTITIAFFNKDISPADIDILEKMRSAYDDVQYDSYNYFTDGNFALVQMNIDILTENPIEEQPVKSPSGRYIGAGRMRIDNRDDLINSLGLAGKTDIDKLSDISLYLHAFEKWEFDTNNHIFGDLMPLIWDKQDRKIIILSGHSGIYPLYYYETSKAIYFSSTITAFFKLPDFTPEVNYEHLICRMLPFQVKSGDEDTFYTNIFNINRFHNYIFSSSGLEKKERWWKPENLSPINYKNNDDYIEHFLDIYSDAVSKRISTKGRTGSNLSGGLDSSSSTVLAIDQLRKKGKKIYSYSSVPAYPDKCPKIKSISDETPYVQSILDMYPDDIAHNFVNAKDFYPIDAIDIDLKYNKLFTSNFQNGFWHWRILQLAAGDNVNVLLNGQAGNLTISRTGAGLYHDLLRQYKLIELFSEWKSESRHTNKSLFTTSLGSIRKITKTKLSGLFPKKLHESLGRDHLIPFCEETLNRFELIDKHLNQLKAKSAIKYRNNKLNNFENRKVLEKHISNTGSNSNIDYNLINKIETRDATNDRRVSEFTKQIPAGLFKHEGIGRYLIRSAMKGKLPEKVLSNTKRGKQAKDLSYRVLLDMNRTEKVINTYSNDGIIRFDKNKISETLENIKSEKYTQDLFSKTTKLILHTIATIKFIEQIEI